MLAIKNTKEYTEKMIEHKAVNGQSVSRPRAVLSIGFCNCLFCRTTLKVSGSVFLISGALRAPLPLPSRRCLTAKLYSSFPFSLVVQHRCCMYRSCTDASSKLNCASSKVNCMYRYDERQKDDRILK